MNQLMSKWIKHSVDYDKYGNNVSDKASRYLLKEINSLINSIPKKSYLSTKGEVNSVLEKVDNMTKELKNYLLETYEKSITSISTVQTKWLKKIMKQAGVEYTFPTSVINSVNFSPIANQTDYKSIINNLCLKLNQTISTLIKNGYIVGESNLIIRDKIYTQANKIVSNMVQDTKLFVNSVFSIFNQATFKKNKEKVYYCSVLDSSVCLECASLSGNIYDIDKAPYLQRHHRCRCTLIPVSIVKDEPILNFSEWLESLSSIEQQEVLGKSRYLLYKNGTIKPNQFVDNGTILTLNELMTKL